MTVEEFRGLALGLPEAEERAHMGHPDFRVSGKIFATLGYPSNGHGALMLTPEQQALYIRAAPEAFSPAAGAWGKAGSTVVFLAAADLEAVGDAMTAAWKNATANAVRKRKPGKGAKSSS